MSEETRQRIFEPFLTTKGAASTGLGLATVHRIIKQNGGDVSPITAPGKGTTFRLYLPRAVRDGAAQHHEAATGGHGTETILLAEDDPAVRRLAKMSLERSGFVVLEAANPDEAVRVSQRHSGPIDLLLSDVIMPQSKGAPLLERLRADRPNTRVLYMSGHTDDAIVHHGVLDEGTPFLQKPFTPHGLTQKVREVLD